ncbi:hypothetical protein B0G57_12626 [Trinickia symbiotica]|uniref:DNA primase n=1 Tax=Trinickia symbiotica TaxID=863227 RepID=A0A2N7WPF7_9BURK|nr:LPD7 domain-containing protein [Trinickia symbiotica]PMS31274.1 DNA primase [Trinickia symbiotica]PPK41697.1 hypothetical protein B0G57_12626 [Trinickia symbiotica]
MAETSIAADPVINLIEQDVPGGSPLAGLATDESRAGRFDAAALSDVAARRRREFDSARARLRDMASPQDARRLDPDSRAVMNEPRGPTDSQRLPVEQPPERVRKRYLRAGNQYFMKDAPYQLAFEDLGAHLVTEHNRPDVVESMVDMAAAKSWQRIRVSGNEAFRSEVWLRATVLGIDVSGYEPKAADLARLADARQTRLNNRIEADASMARAQASAHADGGRPPMQAAKSDEVVSVAGGISRPFAQRGADQVVPQQAANDEQEAPRSYSGELREHGRAPYQNNPARSDSYYVVFRDARGDEHIVWGVDLARAVRESRAQPGQEVTLENLGRRLVTVKVPVVDARGVMVGEEEKDVYRNTWQVDVIDRTRSSTRSTVQPEDASGRSSAPIASPSQDRGQERLRSTVSDEDKVLHLAVLTGAMREQGFSARSISRVRQRAEAMLDAFGEGGVQLPRPRVFDPKAPSERDRRTRSTPERTLSREIERAAAEPSLPAR